MRQIFSRLAAPLRAIACNTYINGNSPSNAMRVMKGASAAGLLIPAMMSYETSSHIKSYNALAAGPAGELQSLYAMRDIPQLVLNVTTNAYNSTRNMVYKRIETEGGLTIAAITAANIAVYVLWKVAPSAFMVRHFANSLEAMRKGRVWTSFTSNFSHMGIFHLGANMYLLNRFGPEVADIISRDRFLMFYGTAGVASSLASLAFRRYTRSNVLSLGASGAVVSTLWLYACFFPDRRMSFLGSQQSLSMQEVVLAYAVIDAAGLLGSLGKIDFAAHLGGALFGNSWFYLVRDKLAQEAHERHREKGRRRQSSLGVILRERKEK